MHQFSVTAKQSEDLGLADQTHTLLNRLSTLAHHQGSSASNLELAGGHRRLVDVELSDLDFALESVGHLVDDGCQTFARSTPTCREVDKNFPRAVYYLLVKV